MTPKVRFRGEMVAIPTAEVIVLFTRAEFLAALQAEQRRRRTDAVISRATGPVAGAGDAGVDTVAAPPLARRRPAPRPKGLSPHTTPSSVSSC